MHQGANTITQMVNEGDAFDKILRDEDAMLSNLQIDEESDEFQYTNEDLESLKLHLLIDKILEKNHIFVMLRGKLVQFYKKLEQYKEDPASVKIDNLFLRKTLSDSLKKLLRAVINTHDKRL